MYLFCRPTTITMKLLYFEHTFNLSVSHWSYFQNQQILDEIYHRRNELKATEKKWFQLTKYLLYEEINETPENLQDLIDTWEQFKYIRNTILDQFRLTHITRIWGVPRDVFRVWRILFKFLEDTNTEQSDIEYARDRLWDQHGPTSELTLEGVKRLLREIQRFRYHNAGPDDICSICLSENPDVATECNHYFHRYCINQWIQDSCPNCREPL